MATRIENINTRLDAIYVELAAIQSQPIIHKSDAGASRKGELGRHRLQLLEEARMLREALATEDTPFEIVTQGFC